MVAVAASDAGERHHHPAPEKRTFLLRVLRIRIYGIGPPDKKALER
jgi:hypothetical protein